MAQGDDPTISLCNVQQPLTAFQSQGLVLEGVTMASVADMLSIQQHLLGRLVRDRSGLTGLYRVSLSYNFAAFDLHGAERATGFETRTIKRRVSSARGGRRQHAGRKLALAMALAFVVEAKAADAVRWDFCG